MSMSRTSWRLTGAFALAHVALMMAAIPQQRAPRLGEDARAVAAEYAGIDLARVFAAGYLESVAFLLLLPVVAFLGRAVGRRTEAGRWAASTAVVAGTGYIASTLAVGLPAGAAAAYGAAHGADLGTVTVVNDIRNFAFFLSVLLLAVHAGGVAVAVLSDRVLPRWLGWSGLVTAFLLVGSVPFARTGAVDQATLLWIVWFIALATVMLRHRPQGAPAPADADRPAAAATAG